MDEREAALEELRRSVLAEARDDYVGLWSVLRKTHRLLSGTSPLTGRWAARDFNAASPLG